MGLLGISLIVASVVWVILRPPPWLTPLQVLLRWRGTGAIAGPGTAADVGTRPDAKAKPASNEGSHHEVKPGQRAEPGAVPRNRTTAPSSSDHDQRQSQPRPSASIGRDRDVSSASTQQQQQRDAVAMPPPPPPVIQPPTIAEPDDQSTPKAEPAVPSIAVPSFSLDDAPSNPAATPATSLTAPASTPAVRGPTLSAGPPVSPGSMMPPPPPPGRMPPPAGRLPTLAQFPAPNSAQRARGPTPNRGPAPNRGLAPPSAGLAPPPTLSSKPSKPNRKVLLSPGHSPLDWASISGPNADLRGVEPSTPYLRVTPSMLKRMTGRKGKDAWMALNGKVYNVTPYADYHPGGVPELMRGAARDGTKLFGEIHPWVNYETMLAACLVGLLVEESEDSEMDKMD